MSEEKKNDCGCQNSVPPEEATDKDREMAEKCAEQAFEQQNVQIPKIDFSTFLYSMATQAMMLMGEAKVPGAENVQVDLVASKQTIDIIQMLEEKTKGNLSDQEKSLMTNLMYDMRMRYVKASQKKG